MRDATDNGPRWAMIGRGLAGWHATGADGRTWSSGGTLLPSRWWRTGETVPGYAAEALDGAPIYDAEAADAEAFADFIIRGPMVGGDLAPGTWSPLSFDYPRASYPAPDACPTSGVNLAQVAPDVFIRWLRAAVPGVRFGVVRDGAPAWEGGEL